MKKIPTHGAVPAVSLIDMENLKNVARMIAPMETLSRGALASLVDAGDAAQA